MLSRGVGWTHESVNGEISVGTDLLFYLALDMLCEHGLDLVVPDVF